mmetsp:Transcript_10775/g.26053  ORF Transcript_10775/g.26053 Transcript_10775/m.26053 type:complete len:634 (-) Transcript_10775:98-1999(-)
MSIARRRSRASITDRRRQQEEEDQAELYYYSGIERVPNFVTVVHLNSAMKTVPYQAFYLKKVLRKVQFLDTNLRIIHQQAFASCSALEEAILPDSIEEIERGAFSHCTSLHTVYISPNARQFTVISQAAFTFCKSIVSFQVPPSVHTIERAAFSRCERLQHVEFVSLESSSTTSASTSPEPPFESQLQCIQPIAFGGCTGLQTLRLPHGLKQIQNQAFSGCTWLDAVEIPATVEEISSLAFAECHNLKHIALPQDMDLTEMPDDVFQTCHLLNPMLLSAMTGGEASDSTQALQNRFEGLPIHQVCYYSQDQDVLEQLLMLDFDNDGDNDNDGITSAATQDCFGMTPFHILALSGSHHKVVLGLLKLLLKDERFQKVVTKKDIWGYAPLVYACQADSPLPVVKLLLEVHQAAAIASAEKIEAMTVGSPLSEEEVDSDDETEDAITVPWDHLVRHCVSNSVKILRFIVRSCLKDRIQRLGLQQWKTDVTFSIFQIPANIHPEEERTEHIKALCRQLTGFEEREALAILELAVWRASLDRAIRQEKETQGETGHQNQTEELVVEDKGKEMDGQGSSKIVIEAKKVEEEDNNGLELYEDTEEDILRKTRHACRVTCNADVIVINARQYFKIPTTDFF